MTKQNKPKILVPFIGAFSSGKSSLINALLGKNLLSTDITPETALPIELHYASRRSFISCFPDGRREKVSNELFMNADFQEVVSQDGWIEAYLPELKNWPDLVLVDLPGWSSGYSTHERHIDEYLLRLAKTHLATNVFFAIAVAADEGTLRNNLRERIQAMDIGASPYFLVITKTDKRNADDIQQVTAHLKETITDALGKPPQQVLLTSARKRQVKTLSEVMDAIQKSLIPSPSVNVADLCNVIQQHVNHIADASSDCRDIAIYVFDDVWDKLTDELFDELLDFVPYEIAKSRGSAILNDTISAYKQALERNIKQYLPSLDQSVIADMKKLGLNIPDTSVTDDGADKLSRRLKNHIALAIEKSKPGLFSSDDPEEVGKRIQSRLRGMRQEFRADIIDCAYSGLRRWMEKQIEDWQRVRRLIAP